MLVEALFLKIIGTIVVFGNTSRIHILQDTTLFYG